MTSLEVMLKMYSDANKKRYSNLEDTRREQNARYGNQYGSNNYSREAMQFSKILDSSAFELYRRKMLD